MKRIETATQVNERLAEEAKKKEAPKKRAPRKKKED